MLKPHQTLNDDADIGGGGGASPDSGSFADAAAQVALEAADEVGGGQTEVTPSQAHETEPETGAEPASEAPAETDPAGGEISGGDEQPETEPEPTAEEPANAPLSDIDRYIAEAIKMAQPQAGPEGRTDEPAAEPVAPQADAPAPALTKEQEAEILNNLGDEAKPLLETIKTQHTKLAQAEQAVQRMQVYLQDLPLHQMIDGLEGLDEDEYGNFAAGVMEKSHFLKRRALVGLFNNTIEAMVRDGHKRSKINPKSVAQDIVNKMSKKTAAGKPTTRGAVVAQLRTQSTQRTPAGLKTGVAPTARAAGKPVSSHAQWQRDMAKALGRS